ncbi:MAG: TatD family hydrolase [Candidatus Micrarchaeaceae archaeon]
MRTSQVVKDKLMQYKQKTESADAHCHLDLISDSKTIKDAIMDGVHTIVTNGVDTKSNMRSLELVDNRNIFAMLGVDPEHAGMSDEELEFNINTIRQNCGKIVGIGEIGLDYGIVKDTVLVERQKHVFEKFIELAEELRLPVSIHSRDALDDVIHIIEKSGLDSVHIHFFEGNVQQAKEVERLGYMISIPPLHSGKRSKVIKEIAIDNIMAESDAPVVGASPKDIDISIGMVAEIKKLEFAKAADLLNRNSKRFFRIHTKAMPMRS